MRFVWQDSLTICLNICINSFQQLVVIRFIRATALFPITYHLSLQTGIQLLYYSYLTKSKLTHRNGSWFILRNTAGCILKSKVRYEGSVFIQTKKNINLTRHCKLSAILELQWNTISGNIAIKRIHRYLVCSQYNL